MLATARPLSLVLAAVLMAACDGSSGAPPADAATAAAPAPAAASTVAVTPSLLPRSGDQSSTPAPVVDAVDSAAEFTPSPGDPPSLDSPVHDPVASGESPGHTPWDSAGIPEPPPETATPAPPARVYSGLIGDMQQVLNAQAAGDGERLVQLLAVTEGPCVVDPAPGILIPPACPEDASAGALVPAIMHGTCPDQPGFLAPSITYEVRTAGGGGREGAPVGVVDLGMQPMRYAALWATKTVAWLGFDAAGRLIGAGVGCSPARLKPRLAGSLWLWGPEWAD